MDWGKSIKREKIRRNNMKSIYDLKLHESIKVAGDRIATEVTRVPGGWIYNLMTEAKKSEWYSSLVFVPFDNGFMGKEDFWSGYEEDMEKTKTVDDVLNKSGDEQLQIFKGKTPA